MSSAVLAQLTATGDDGREVILNEDGSWQYRSSDRFARTSDGRRIRLRADGRWQYDSDQSSGSTLQFRNSAVDVSMQRVEIEQYKEAATAMRKNPRVSTQTSFYFTVTASPLGEPLVPKLDTNDGVIDGFSVTDDQANQYSIIEFSPGKPQTIEPGKSISYQLKISGSPKWGPKSIQLTIARQVFKTEQDIVLTTPVSTIERVKGN
jgi:hypothetical protein